MSDTARQLIFVAHPISLRAEGALDALRAALDGATVRPLFLGASGGGSESLASFHRVDAPDEALDEIASRLRALPFAEGAYVKPATELAVRAAPSVMGPSAETTPDFTPRQGYLDAAPEGVDARYAWELPGGRGAGVHVVDIEGGWDFEHEDLRVNKGGVIGGRPYPERYWRDHGTAVLGVVAGDANSFGVTGVCSDAKVSAVSHRGRGSAPAIYDAVEALDAGDIVLVEAHRPGPRFNFQPRPDQRGFIPVEWWPDDIAVIQYATERGVIVVEAAGNGAEDLDDPLYDQPAKGFPRSWVNPLRREVDTGSIFVGAGAPPPGTHGRDLHGPDRSKLEFSNWGSSLDAQGWGREVTTTGYGDLQGGDEHHAYTDGFSGTSSASPVVVGALGCVQGILRARGQPRLTPASARALLRRGCSPQQDRPGAPVERVRIGGRPDVRRMLDALDAEVSVTPIETDEARSHVWLASERQPGEVDLYAVKVRGTSSGSVELLVLAGAERHRRVTARFITPLSVRDGEALSWAIGEGDDGGAPELHAIEVSSSRDGRVEVRVLAPGDGYATIRERRLVPFAEAHAGARRAPTGDLARLAWVSFDREDGAGCELRVLRGEGTASGFVELHPVRRRGG